MRPDLKLHTLGGVIIVSFCLAFGLSLTWALGACVVVAAGKELIVDRLLGGTSALDDFVFTCCGGLAAGWLISVARYFLCP